MDLNKVHCKLYKQVCVLTLLNIEKKFQSNFQIKIQGIFHVVNQIKVLEITKRNWKCFINVLAFVYK